MESVILDGYLAPVLVPAIMSINLSKQMRSTKLDLLYASVTLGTVISSITNLLHFHCNRYTHNRTKLTILKAAVMTTSLLLSIIGFHIIRVNFLLKAYEFPVSIRGQALSNPSEVFRYHFFADIIPGFLLATQANLCSLISHELLVKAKRNFTLGEASIVSQVASAAYLTWILTTYTEISGAGPFEVSLTTKIILNIGVIVFSLVILPPYVFLKSSRTLTRYGLLALGTSVSYARVQNLIAASSNLDPLTWFVDHIFATHQRISLFSVWLSTLTACISFSTSWSRMAGQTNSLVRKVFHLAVVVVFVSGYNQDLEFTRFAAGGMIVIMFLVETIRAWQLKPLGRHLEYVCQSLRGKWDNKYLTLSHIYLLLGVFLPLWLLPNDSITTSKLMLSSGLLSLGVGDTAAAVVGTFFGKIILRERTGKTLEGLAGNLLAMILFKLCWVGYSSFVSEFTFILAAVLTSLVEAFTKACDNLILPLVMILFLEL